MKTQANPKTATAKKATAGSKKSSVKKPQVKPAVATNHKGEKSATNSRPSTDEIAARAYKIWQQQGCPDGREAQHWWQAEQEIINDGSHNVNLQP